MPHKNLEIVYDPHPSEERKDYIESKLADFAIKKRGLMANEDFGFYIHEQGQIIGGMNGLIYYGCLYIDQLWLDESIRFQGIGTKMLQKAEELAISKKCLFINVTTMDWEAKDFYLKFGFHLEFERYGYPNNSIMHYLRKDLQ